MKKVFFQQYLLPVDICGVCHGCQECRAIPVCFVVCAQASLAGEWEGRGYLSSPACRQVPGGPKGVLRATGCDVPLQGRSDRDPSWGPWEWPWKEEDEAVVCFLNVWELGPLAMGPVDAWGGPSTAVWGPGVEGCAVPCARRTWHSHRVPGWSTPLLPFVKSRGDDPVGLGEWLGSNSWVRIPAQGELAESAQWGRRKGMLWSFQQSLWGLWRWCTSVAHRPGHTKRIGYLEVHCCTSFAKTSDMSSHVLFSTLRPCSGSWSFLLWQVIS